MSLPPERIAVKRRRQEDPVEALYLQENSTNNQKRRFTEYYFKLLRDGAIAPASPKRVQSQAAQPLSVQLSTVDTSGIPTVKTSAPGDEVEDFKQSIAAQKARRGDEQSEFPGQPARTSTRSSQSPEQTPRAVVSFKQARRFHLARTLSSFYSPHPSGGIRKHPGKIRPPLATFVERQTALLAGQEDHVKPPVDRILPAPPSKAEVPEYASRGLTENLSSPSAPKSEATAFVKPVQPKKKWGTSINDHPSTWDLESDQLADELSALAMEMDEDVRPASRQRTATLAPQPRKYAKPDVNVTDVNMADDFIYETYIRVTRHGEAKVPDMVEAADANYGLIVIDDEDEELWQQYMEDEEDSDWDEEDSNAEDHPANDYPDEEISSDDEFGRGAYNHRQYASDDEEYDDGNGFD